MKQQELQSPQIISSSRLDYVDYAKSIAIFLVVLGHTNGAYVAGKSWLYLDFCYAFHMPLFFMLSGFFIRPKEVYGKEGFLQTCNKNFLSLLLPYLIWGIVYMPFSYTNIARLLYGSWLALNKIGTLTSLWFLPVLCLGRFYCNIVYGFAWHHKFSFQKTGWFALPFLFAVGFLLPHYNRFGIDHGTLWGYDIAFVAAGFMLTGSLCRNGFDRIARAPLKWSILLFFLCAAIFLAGFFLERPLLTPGVDRTMLMANAEYGPIGFCLSNAFFGSFAVIFLAIILARFIPGNTLILFIGANTMGIYLLHKNLIFALKDVFATIGIVPNTLWSALVIAVPAFAISLAMMVVFLKFAPWIFGKTFGAQSQLSLKEMFSQIFVREREEELEK